MENENNLVKERIRKLNEIKEMGINPYPYSFEKKNYSSDLLEKYSKLKPEEKTDDKVCVAGRIMLKRDMGKASFFNIQDQNGKIQIYIRQDDVGKDNYLLFKKLDIGDIVGIKGIIFKTKKGEISVHTKNFTLLTKSIRPLPEKYHSLQDQEIKYRKRYLDLIMNKNDVFLIRAKILREIREYMNDNDFIECDIPILETQYGGAAAKPFTTKHNALGLDLFLRISLELPLKKIMVGGLEKVYSMSRVFRNEGIDVNHNPEFSMIEWYEAYVDYNKTMDRCEEVFKRIAKSIGKDVYEFEGHKIDVKKPFKRLTMKQALLEFAKIDFDKLSIEELEKIRKKENIELKLASKRGVYLSAFFEHFCEDKLIQPTFIIDHPIEISPLTKEKRDGEKEIVERAELFIAGHEMSNIYSELNEPIEQRKRLVEQKREENKDEAYQMDEDFCEAIDYGMPPAGGIGIGIDRLTMLFTEQKSIRDVLFFPTMKPIKE